MYLMLFSHFRKEGYKKTGDYTGYNFSRIKNSLSEGTPLIISAYALRETYTYRTWFLGPKKTGYRYDVGHAWVLDGWISRKRRVDIFKSNDIKNPVDYYYEYDDLVHCNYGWSGRSDGYYNSTVFTTNAGPVTRKSGQRGNYQFKLEVLYDVKP
ncbi:MAG: C10 family peptidase [Capnocytophaga sp.]|nr:C10 family peptidase [Capnocytophaga sp.]